jgi:DNA-binding transcriptional regulator YiaG
MDVNHEVSAIEKQSIREFDDACLTPVQSLDLIRI